MYNNNKSSEYPFNSKYDFVWVFEGEKSVLYGRDSYRSVLLKMYNTASSIAGFAKVNKDTSEKAEGN